MSRDVLIAADGPVLAVFPLSMRMNGPDPVLEWRGEQLRGTHYVAEWEELVDRDGKQVGIRLELAESLHPPFWEWVRRFQNVGVSGNGDADILFRACGDPEPAGPFLPVEAFRTAAGDFVLWVPEFHDLTAPP